MQGMPILNWQGLEMAQSPYQRIPSSVLQLACGEILKLEILFWTVVCVRLLNVHGRVGGNLLSN